MLLSTNLFSSEYYDSGSISSVFLDKVTCPTGDEDSLLQCMNGGWSDVSTECTNPAMGVSVYCYSEGNLPVHVSFNDKCPIVLF